jgi:hypothetical protein
VESLTELIRQDPDKAFELTLQMPKDELAALLGALPFEEFGEMQDRAFIANLNYGIENKIETP